MENDLISRQAVIELVEGWWLGHTKEDDLATEIKKLPSADKTQMVDKSNFDMNQYKADLETARDCEKAKWLKCIEDIKAEITKEYNRAVLNYEIRCEGELKEQYRGLFEGYNSALKIIDRHVDELRGADE